MPPHPGGAKLAVLTVSFAAAAVTRWAGDARVLLTAILWMIFVRKVREPRWMEAWASLRWLRPSITALMALAGVTASPIFSGSRPPRHRWGFTVFLIGTTLSIYANRSFFAAELASVRWLRAGAMIALVCAFYYSNNTQFARQGLTQPLSVWAECDAAADSGYR